MGFGLPSDISDQIGQTINSQGLNPVPGNVVGNMGQPTMAGQGGQASPYPGNSLGINNPGGTGGVNNLGAPGQGNNSMEPTSGMFGKGLNSPAPASNVPGGIPMDALPTGTPGGMFGKGGGYAPGGPATQNPFIQKGVMPQGIGQSNLPNPPLGGMPPGQVMQATPAPQLRTKPAFSSAPQQRPMPRRRAFR